MLKRLRRRSSSSSSSNLTSPSSQQKKKQEEELDTSTVSLTSTLDNSAFTTKPSSSSSPGASKKKGEDKAIAKPALLSNIYNRGGDGGGDDKVDWWAWKNAGLAFLLAIVLACTVKGYGAFTRMEDNGFALVASTAPGSHWGNWRSLTRCDCKAFHQCTAALSKTKTLSAYRLGRAFQLATCKLATGQDDDCQLTDKEIKRGLTRFRFFWPELVLRIRLAADFRFWVRLGVYFLMSCALLEIIIYLVETTHMRWQRKGALKQEGSREWWQKEICVWVFLVTWHELLSYVVHYLYNDNHTMCDGTGLFFRDAMALYTLVQVVQRAVFKRGPNAHRAWLIKAEQKFAMLQGRPMWVQVVRDPRVGAFHMFSGLDLKLWEDPVGVIGGILKGLMGLYEKVSGLVPGLLPALGGRGGVEGPVAVGAAAGNSSSRKKDE